MKMRLPIQEVVLMWKVSVDDFAICTCCTFSWRLSLSNFSIILQAAAGGDEEFFRHEEYGESFIHEQRVGCIHFISVPHITCAIILVFAATLAN